MSEDEGTNSVPGAAAEGSAGDDGAETEAEAGVEESEGDSAPEEAQTKDVGQLLDEIAELDDDLAREVNVVVETARDLNGTVSDQREELADLRERVDAQAETIEELRADLDDREERIDELESHLKRKQADFQNYKKRAKKRQEQIKSRATEDLVERLVGVRDNLKRALAEESDDVESLREGVEMTLKEFDRVLADEDVEEIDPDPGSDVDPQRHEVMVQVDSGQPEGTIADVYTPGYEMDGKVIQNAQVTVSNGELDGDEVAKAGEDDANDGAADEGDTDADEPVDADGGALDPDGEVVDEE
ncbi:nucleotide exchange factor GrpE [Salinilacihabitans rarus]|uniref:nucleotide exchange factor GrpE n=1 Tax=Salinilacihabitans rarus TaxID=2961596 RepID=UPI0020C90FEF|nr:nucleotide exchange factor GrpE [Salinilacihabitans rarus]